MLSYLKKSQRLFILLMAGLLCSTSLWSQRLSEYNWYFGNSNKSIRFSRSSGAASLGTSATLGTGGSAVVSDQTNGNLLFYTDGTRVYDASNAVMPNGAGLSGDPTQNQPVAVCRVPGNKNQYYIFYRDAAGQVFFSIVDMTLGGNSVFPAPASGDVTATKNVSLGLTGQSSAMTIVSHTNNQDFWLITHSSTAAQYAVTRITSAGAPFTTTLFTGGLVVNAANFSYNQATGQIAVAPQETTRDIDVVKFDNTTGVITYVQSVPNTAVATMASGQAIYDTEWSSDGRFLYISVAGDAGPPPIQADVLQYDFKNPGTTLASVLPQPNAISRSYGLQMAPDSSIYHLYQATNGGPFLVGKITQPDSVASLAAYVPNAFPSAPNFAGRQFPEFAPKDSTNITVAFTSSGTCANTPTSFYPTVVPTADSLNWDFGDGATARDWSPVHTYTAAGTYNVKVKAYLNGDTTSTTVPVTITQFNLKVQLPSDTTACSCELDHPRAKNPPPPCGRPFTLTAQVSGGTPASTQWYGPSGLLTGQTSSTIKSEPGGLDSAGYYYVVVTDASGCSAYAGSNVKEYGVQDARANIWYFGKNAGIDFNPVFRTNNPGPPQPITGPLNTPEGCADICDRNGQIVFSTDGQNIFDRQGTDITPAPNPPGLGGDPNAAESSLIIPVPGDETLYYIFTTQAMEDGTFELRYSLFDLKKRNGLGDVVQSNQLLFARSTERICSDGTWLIAHEFGNNSFRAYKITATGIQNPVITSIGSDHTTIENGEGYMTFGANQKIAVALSTNGVSNVVELFDFDSSKGTLSNYKKADLKDANGQVYGVLLNGINLYATLSGTPTSKLYEFYLDSLGTPHLKGTLSNPINQQLGAIQIAPNGTIYVAENGQASLGVITPNQDTTTLSTFTLNQFALAGATSSNLGLPNFVQVINDPQQGPGMSITGFCLGSPTDFSGSGTDKIDVLTWFFGDGSGSPPNTQQTTHTYAAPGTYLVQLKITNRCGFDTLISRSITIVPPPSKPNFFEPGDPTTLCNGPITLEATPATDPNLSTLKFVWSTGDTTRTTTVSKPSNVSVTITNAAGCTSTGSMLVADPRPVVELGPNLTVCQNSGLPPLDAQNPGDTYLWQINNTPSGTSQTQSVNTTVPGNFTYTIAVTDPVTTCVAKDTITYTINPSPVFTTPVIGPTTCGASTGTINFDITAPTGTLFSYSLAGPQTDFQQNHSTDHVTSTALSAGSYGITVSDQVSGCLTTAIASVNDNAFTVSATSNGTCDPGMFITGAITPGQASFSYRVINTATSNTVYTVASRTGGSYNTQTDGGAGSILSGANGTTYVVEVTAGACVNTSPPILIKQNAPLSFSTPAFDLSNLCTSNVIIANAPTATGFVWSTDPVGGISSSTLNNATLTADTVARTWKVRVTATDGIDCPAKDSITVTVQRVSPKFVQSTPCNDPVVLSVTSPVTGSYTYRWYENGTLLLGGRQLQVGLPDNGAAFSVDVVSAANGCVYHSPQQTIQVTGEVTIAIAGTPPCEGSPFTLTANTNQPSPTFRWERDGKAITGATSSTLQDSLAGTYTATALVGTCTASANFPVSILPKTPGNLHPVAFICDEAPPESGDSHTTLKPGAGFISYYWYKDGVALGVSTDTLTVNELGTFSVDLVNSFGCRTNAHTEVDRQCDPKIVGPTAFRPDGLNTNFFLYTFFIEDTDFQVFIFNRWGEMVYQSNDRYFKWNGGFNNTGQSCPPGTYAYVVKYKSKYNPERGVQEKHGGVVLLR